MRRFLKTELKDFNKHFSKPLLIPSLVNKFINSGFKETYHRTLISSFYIFILEAQALLDLLKRRSANKGSIEPFLSHLHKGGLILESIFKEIYTSLSSETLRTIVGDPFIRQDLKLEDYQTGNIGKTLEDIVKHLLPRMESDRKKLKIHNQWFRLSYYLRNTTSHSLLWPDVFDESIYRQLYRQILFSIFYLIKEKYVK